MFVLVGDIGGTKTLLSIAQVTPPAGPGQAKITFEGERRYDSHAFAGLAEMCQRYAADLGEPLPRAAAFGVAGPVVKGTSKITNLPWIIHDGELRSTLGLDRCVLVNDFVALAHGVTAVESSQLVTLHEGVSDPTGAIAVIGAGTGLGEAIAIREGDGSRRVLPTEGGHGTFAPRDELEMAIVRNLSPRWGRVSWERLLSGDGLVCLAEAIAAITGLPMPPPLWEQIQTNRHDAPSKVTELADAGDPLCKRALELFCTIYGVEAGDFALRAMASCGVYVAGGIAPRILKHLQDGRFRSAYIDKGRMRRVVEPMPVRVVLDPQTPLRGSALLAAALV
ncbi:MAG: glucokinase [Deltaproteobacteria bacterium]|nr:glucokinase [Deltaproteobacteria bacterium]